jgi:phospholipase/lecithinase/hemolysin
MLRLPGARVAALVVVLTPLATQAGTNWSAPSHHDDAAFARHELGFDRIVTFGDSLSDPGNAYLATGDFVVRPFDPVPAAPYLIGRFRFSNGPTWIEWLARGLRLPRSGRPALLRPGIYTNYAIGGTRARESAGPVDLGTQIDLFLGDFGGLAPPEALYAIWIGSNDLRDVFAALEPDPTGAASEAIIAEALEATGDAIERLWDAGASSFLVLNLPDIALAPATRTLGADAHAAAHGLSILYNTGLEQTLQGLETLPGLEDIVILRLDIFAILNAAAADPESVGLINVTDSCITPDVVRGAICRRPDTYLFWDYVHPTTQAHRLLAKEAKAVLATILEDFESVQAERLEGSRPSIDAR